MKILYISQYFPPEMGAPAARAGGVGEALGGRGAPRHCINRFSESSYGVVPLRVSRQNSAGLVVREKVDGVDVVRSWLLPFPNRKAYERMLKLQFLLPIGREYRTFLAAA